MLMGAFKAAMVMYISHKFGGILSGTSEVNAAQLCTAGINQQLGPYARLCHAFLVNNFGAVKVRFMPIIFLTQFNGLKPYRSNEAINHVMM